jgi:hypothetical protein
MTSNPDALLPSAKEVMQKIALADAEEAENQARMRAEAQAEKKALIEQLSKPSCISDDDAIRHGIAMIERAMKNRMTEVEVFRFPTSCSAFALKALWRRLIEDCHWITQKITQSLSNDRSLASS